LQTTGFGIQSFDPLVSINSGQTFLWEKVDNNWYGINGEAVLKITPGNHGFNFSSKPDIPWERDFFRLDDDTESVHQVLSGDSLVGSLLERYQGLRLLRQDPEQCFFSFLCASNSSIPMIRLMLRRLARKFGRRVEYDGRDFFTFPAARVLAKASKPELKSCGLGYRAKAIGEAARLVGSGEVDFEELRAASYSEAKARLLGVYGVGNKIADCVLLFSLDKLDSFPIDVWIARSLSYHYRWLHGLQVGDKLTSHQYELISERMREYFGKYCGYAQQYLYYDIRQRAGRRW
jgi:N-glycosylase/DNA lyase